MSTDKQLWALQLFSEKVRKLSELSFTQKVLTGPTGIKVSWGRDQPVTLERNLPSDESTDAFVLTLRFFIQDNEACSFRNMTTHFDKLNEQGIISTETKDHWNQYRDAINEFLDTKSNIVNKHQVGGVEILDENFTNRRIVDVFVYGGLSHANYEKSVIFEGWKEVDIFFGLVQNQFVFVVGSLVRALIGLNELVNKAKEEAESALLNQQRQLDLPK